ncbi:hypothetical protein [Arthrobacter sp. MMS18-M83]|uniref:hypothetical protein n=1 Tax=Arthrobacter sp. MMS18-M83 TaxID=2996261 RepID=UPI003FA3BE38
MTATVIGGLTAYLLCRAIKSSIARLLIVLAALTAVLLVGISRIYLGASTTPATSWAVSAWVCFFSPASSHRWRSTTGCTWSNR